MTARSDTDQRIDRGPVVLQTRVRKGDENTHDCVGAETPTLRRARLFNDDPGHRFAPFSAIVACVLLAFWMLIGMISETQSRPHEAGHSNILPSVEVSTLSSTAEDVWHVFEGRGTTQPLQTIELTAPISGTINQLFANKGAYVEEGDLIAKFDATQIVSELAKLRAETAQAKLELNIAEALHQKDTATALRVSKARANHMAATANQKQALENLKRHDVRAPFGGRLETMDVVKGETLQQGTRMLQIIDLSSVLIPVQVPQDLRQHLRNGMSADIHLSSGPSLTGEIVFLANVADPGTRKFRADIRIANQRANIPVGIDANVVVSATQSRAHFIKPEFLSLNDAGAVGLKIVDPENHVWFHPVTIIKTEQSGLWLSGLPEEIQYLTSGRGMVSDGDLITPNTDTILAGRTK